MPSAIPCILSPFISHIHSSLSSDWRCTVSSKFFDTKVPTVSTRAANSNLNLNSKELDLFAELELELATQNFVGLKLENI